jgi:hypothetical protein
MDDTNLAQCRIQTWVTAPLVTVPKYKRGCSNVKYSRYRKEWSYRVLKLADPVICDKSRVLDFHFSTNLVL